MSAYPSPISPNVGRYEVHQEAMKNDPFRPFVRANCLDISTSTGSRILHLTAQGTLGIYPVI